MFVLIKWCYDIPCHYTTLIFKKQSSNLLEIMKLLESNYKIFMTSGILKCVPFTFKKSNDKMYSVLLMKIHVRPV